MLIAGVDEAGRGPLAGPVIAAAVILDPHRPVAGVADSKTLTGSQRERLAARIEQCALAVAVGRAEVDEIDRINILQASLLAMQRAVLALPVAAQRVVVDGNRAPALPVPVETVVKGDRCIPAISAASIIAKVYRDEEMTRLHARFPGYGFDRHKGYPTRAHLQALAELGVSPVHRRSYRPVQRFLG